MFSAVKDLYDDATFRLGKDYTIEACHNDMEKGTNGNNRVRANHPACQNLTKDGQSLVFKGKNQFVNVTVQEIKTIHSGICYGKFKILEH